MAFTKKTTILSMRMEGKLVLTRVIEYYKTNIAHGYFSRSLHNRFNVYVAALCKNYDRKYKQQAIRALQYRGVN